MKGFLLGVSKMSLEDLESAVYLMEKFTLRSLLMNTRTGQVFAKAKQALGANELEENLERYHMRNPQPADRLYSSLDRAELERRLWLALCKRLGLPQLRNPRQYPQWYNRFLEEVGKGYGISFSSKTLSTDQMEEHLVGVIAETTSNFLKQLGKSLDTNPGILEGTLRISIEKEERLKEMLQLGSLTASSLKGAARSAVSAGSVLFVLKTFGFGTYMATTTAIHAIGLLLGISLPFAVYTASTTLLSFILGFGSIFLVGATAILPALRKVEASISRRLAGIIWLVAMDAGRK